MGNKILLTWNIRAGKEREHFQRIRDFAAKLSALGLDLADGWYTIYGDVPQVLLGIVAQTGMKEPLQNVLVSKEWEEMIEELQRYITDYRQRLVEAAGQFQF